MPKKTKQEKILARERRFKLLRELQVVEVTPSRIEKNIQKPQPPQDSTAPIGIEREEDKSARQYFVSDFKKSLMYVGVIIALEIAVYFGTISNYFKF